MLHITVEGVSPTYSKNAESSRFQMDADGLRNAEGTVVARVHSGHWGTDDAFHTRWNCNGPVHVTFEFVDSGEPENLGTYRYVTVCGTALRNDGSEYLATLSDGHWRCCRTNADLARILLT